MSESAPTLLRLVTAIGIWVFLLAAMLIDGGVEALRRHRGVIVFMGGALVAFALAIPELERLSGGAIGIVLLGGSVLTSLVLMFGAAANPPRRGPAERRPGVRLACDGSSRRSSHSRSSCQFWRPFSDAWRAGDIRRR